MVDRAGQGYLWALTAYEFVVLIVLVGLLTASLIGWTSLFSSLSRPVRIGAVVFLTIELLIPLWVYVDLRRRPDTSSALWIHVTAMPVINLFGFIAYLHERKRKQMK
jgi:hypothetical protein